MSYEVSPLTAPLGLGEGPHWHRDQQALYFVDIVHKTIHKYSPDSNTHNRTKFEAGAHFLIPVEGTRDEFVVGAGRKFLIIRWDGEEGSPARVLRELGEVDQHRPRNVINDGKADPRGRIYTGTMDAPDNFDDLENNKGSMYRVEAAPGGRVVTQAINGSVSVSNGLAWDLRERAFYYVDSMEKKVRRYDYNPDTGNILNKTYIFDLQHHDIDGNPDGMTIDTDGNLWVAVFGASCVLKVDPRSGKLLDKIQIPAKQVTSATFGGPGYDVLYVTTASLKVDEEEHPPPCGALFKVTGLGVKGHPNVNFKQ